MRDEIRIEGLRVDCVVGVYPHERNARQPLELDLDLILDVEQAALQETVERTVDYAAISAQVVFLLQAGRFHLLETAAHAIAKLLLAPPALGERREPIEAIRLKLKKPGALSGFATPSLRIERDRRWCKITHEEKAWGRVDVLHETSSVGIYRLNIAPQQGIPLHIHRVMRESEMVVSAGLECQLQPVPMGTVHRWPHGAAHRYDNPSDQWQTILCIDSPPFLPSDEILVEGEPADVPPEPPWGPTVGAYR